MATMNADNNTDWMSPSSIRGNDTLSAALGKDLTVNETKTLLGITTNGTAAVGQLPGTTTNDSAAAGKVGEFVYSEVLAGSPVSISDATPSDLTSISLSAGDWDVWGNVHLTGVAMINILGWISTTSAVIPNGAYYSLQNLVGLGTADWAASVPYRRFSFASTTTVYLGVYQDGTGAADGVGTISARRAR
jgi:hypothetical protein